MAQRNNYFNESALSVCIPAYNEERNIARCLESVINQKGVVVTEILVGINSSTDRTKEIVLQYAEQDSRVKVVDSKKGKANAWNALNKVATNNLRIFIDGDCWVDQDAFAKLNEQLKDNDIVTASLYRCTTKSSFIGKVIGFPAHFFSKKKIIHGQLYLMDYFKIRRKMREKIGREEMPADIINEDTFLLMVADKINIDENVFVKFEPVDSLREEYKRFKRMNVGRRRLKSMYPLLWEKAHSRMCNNNVFVKTFLKCSLKEKLLFPYFSLLKFILYRIIYLILFLTREDDKFVWK